MQHNGWLATSGRALLGREFVFVFCSFYSYSVYFESFGLPGPGCRLVSHNYLFSFNETILKANIEC